MIKNLTYSLLVFLFILGMSSCASDSSKNLFVVDLPEDIVSLNKGFYKSKISADGKLMLLTDQSNNGLKVYDTYSKGLTYLTRATDAGLEAGITEDGKRIYYVMHNYDDKKRTSTLYLQNIKSGIRNAIVENIRSLKMVKTNKDVLLFYQNGELKLFDLASGDFKTELNNINGVFSDNDLRLAVYSGGNASIIDPAGEGNYLWPSLSPDESKVLFTLSGKGSFIADIDGNNLVKLGDIRAPKWSPSGLWVVGMQDEDDGQKFTKSDLFIVSADGKKRQNLTKETDVIALYPEFTPDGKTIAFNDEKGKVYWLHLN